MNFLELNQLNHQESRPDNLQQLTYKPAPLLTIPVLWFLALTGRLNYHAIDNCDVTVYNSDYPLEYNSNNVPDPDNIPMK